MKVSLSWLKEFVDIKKSPEEIADTLTMLGLEVDSYQDRYDYLNQFIAAKIIEIKPHPNADKLSLCKVDTGDKIISVVCGAKNIFENMTAPLALPKNVMFDGTILKAGKIRGEKSEGMLCSANELGIDQDSSGILDLTKLDKDIKAGSNLKTVLNLSDIVFEIDLTPNRADCLSIIGIAREIASFYNKEMKYPHIKEDKKEGEINKLISVIIDDENLCPRYAAKLIVDVEVKESPFWLKDKLISLGLKPINNVVDVTNFVMFEMGQPLHSFDYDTLSKNKIIVKCAKDGDVFKSLDDKERKLNSNDLMICDGEKEVGIAGVMGGLNSEISNKTTKVLLESAYFNPISIKRTAKKLGINSDASHRFERGIDPENTINAMLRAAYLIKELGGGTLIDGYVDNNPVPFQKEPIIFSISKCNKLLGLDLSQEKIKNILERLNFEIEVISEDKLKVLKPSYRVDIKIEEDLSEEVARFYGYNNIEIKFPKIQAATDNQKSQSLQIKEKTQKTLISCGFNNTITYPFLSKKALKHFTEEEILENKLIEILNPIIEDQAVMRTSLIPSLLDIVRKKYQL